MKGSVMGRRAMWLAALLVFVGLVVPAGVTPSSAQEDDGALLPTNRILTYYGHPATAQMGILGAYDMEELHGLLQDQATEFEAADPARPVLLAFEIIATVAQPEPGEDGDYLLYTDDETLSSYIEYAAENDMLVFLDVQLGRSTVEQEIDIVRQWLEMPNVHLALDPEYAMAEGETPGVDLGGIDAADVTFAQEELAAIAAEHNLPPKILVVHQFRESMIRDKTTLEPVAGVQLVIDMDGFGDPDIKTEVYNTLVRDEPVEFAGIKLFYDQDVPLMTPEEVVALEPAPDVIIYQ